MVNFSCATPWLLHASLFSRKDDIVQEHPPCELRISCVSRIRTAPSPDIRGCANAETKSPPPSKEDGGLRCSRINGVRIGRAAGGLMAGALQEFGRRVRCKGRNRRAPCKGRNGRRSAGAKLRRSARGSAADADCVPRRTGHAGKPRPRPAARDLLPFAGVV